MDERLDRTVFVLLRTILLAAVSGAAAVVILWMIRLLSNLVYYGNWSVDAVSPMFHDLNATVILIPVAGALCAWFLRAWPPLAAALNIGSGIPLGPEGAAMAFGRMVAQWGKGTAAEQELFMLAGISAGFAGLFGTPLAAMVLIFELLTLRKASFIALAAVIGAGMHFMMLGMAPFWQMPALSFPGWDAMGLYSLEGIAAGLTAALLIVAVKAVQRLTAWWWPLVSAAVTGLAGWYAPDILGNGIEQIGMILKGSVLLLLLIHLLTLKLFVVSFSLGTRTQGGTLLPLFSIGASLGIMTALGLQWAFPATQLHPSMAALAGMAALFAGASRGWLTAIVFAVECTREPNAIIPSALACTMAYVVAGLLLKKRTASDHPTQTSAR